jgi:hypothetical protein
MSTTVERSAPPKGEMKTDPARDHVRVHVDYISADHPIQRDFPETAQLSEIKQWAQQEFVPHPPSDKTFYLVDERTGHRFTESEEQKSLGALGYKHAAHFRLNEEQVAG